MLLQVTPPNCKIQKRSYGSWARIIPMLHEILNCNSWVAVMGKYLFSAHFYSTINKHNMCASNMSFRLLTAWRSNGWKVTERLSKLVELLEWLTVWLWQYESRIWRNKLLSSENKDTRSRFTYIKYEVQFGIWNHRNISIN